MKVRMYGEDTPKEEELILRLVPSNIANEYKVQRVDENGNKIATICRVSARGVHPSSGVSDTGTAMNGSTVATY